jgi:hypothetical protein
LHRSSKQIEIEKQRWQQQNVNPLFTHLHELHSLSQQLADELVSKEDVMEVLNPRLIVSSFFVGGEGGYDCDLMF